MISYSNFKVPFVLCALTIGLFVSACGGSTIEMRQEIAQRIAAPSWMVKRQIPAGAFALTVYERMHERFAPANIYIEGDGLAWLSRTRKSFDPTPKNPVALHLAPRDKADNLVYLARPCQYSGRLDGAICDDAYWGQKRFAPEVIESYMAALDEIKKRYDIQGFNLVGYSGGAAVAALLAAERDDILSLRTVAGNLDHQAHSAYHDVSVLQDSLNPVDYTAHLALLPQYHFTGAHDTVVPSTIVQGYMNALPEGHCAKHEVVSDVDHETGWVDQWPDLLAKRPVCDGLSYETIELPPFEPYEAPVRVQRPKPEKP